MVEINSRKSLRSRLDEISDASGTQLDDRAGALIGIRAALRVTPIFWYQKLNSKQFDAVSDKYFRSLLAVYMHVVENNIQLPLSQMGYSNILGSARATVAKQSPPAHAAFAAELATGIIGANPNAISSVASKIVSTASTAMRQSNVFWASVNDDVQLLTEGTDIECRRLWHDFSIPLKNEWEQCRDWAKARKDDKWRFWRDWYSSHLQGTNKNHEVMIAVTKFLARFGKLEGDH